MPTEKKITIVHCWSAPRSRSTALMYSFDSRPDCQVLDEPLYYRWLVDQGPTVERPYKEFMLTGKGPTEGIGSTANWPRESLSWKERVAQTVDALPQNGGIIFCKHMAKHAYLYDFSNEITGFTHVHLLLLRDPVAVLSAWGAAANNHGNTATPDEVGIVPLLGIYSALRSGASSRRLAVLDADELVVDPALVLADSCLNLGIPYHDKMLSWKPGPKDCDGPWAEWWYKSVHHSTGWTVNADRKYRTLPQSLYAALQASVPAYDYLQQYTHGYRTRGPPSEQIYEDPRNEHLLVYIGASGRKQGRLVPRSQAGISPWDVSVLKNTPVNYELARTIVALIDFFFLPTVW